MNSNASDPAPASAPLTVDPALADAVRSIREVGESADSQSIDGEPNDGESVRFS